MTETPAPAAADGPPLSARRDGTERERCDYCLRWAALSTVRFMGWCMLHGPKPLLPSARLLLDGAPGDAITAYNEVCDFFDQERIGL